MNFSDLLKTSLIRAGQDILREIESSNKEASKNVNKKGSGSSGKKGGPSRKRRTPNQDAEQ